MKMKIEKLGKLFDPREHRLLEGCEEYAQSPQAVVWPDHVRIYFSTRQRDAVGKYLSHVAFVDLDLSLTRVLRVSRHSVLPLGRRGAFDEHGIFPFSPLRRGDRVFAYTTGWTRRVSVSTDSGIGLAESDDGGETFVRCGEGPVLTSSLHEPFLVSDGFVIEHGGMLHIWYIYGQRWLQTSPDAEPDRVYKIAHATSRDGVHWVKSGRAVLSDVLDADECQALPTVAVHGGRFHMLFCYRHATDFRRNPARAYRIGHAVSDDLVSWERAESPLIPPGGAGDWDEQMQCYPNLVHVGQDLFALYNGNEFGRYGFGAARIA
jgi:hypothetical protein